MNQNNTATKEFFKTVTIIHLMLTLGCIAFLAFTFTTLKGDIIYEVPQDPLGMIALALPFATVSVGFYLYNTRIKEACKKTNLIDKCTLYKSAIIVKYALIEGAAFLGVLAFMKNFSIYNLLMVVVLIAVLLTQKPKKDTIAEILALNSEEKMQLGL